MTALAPATPVLQSHAQSRTVAVFALTLFISAAAMFMVQPMAGKMLLPLVGGTPAGWIVALAFFQLALLGGYALANLLSRLSPRRHGMAFVGLLLMGALFLPVSMVPQAGTAGPVMVLRLLACSVGVPFLALSLCASTVQRMFAATGHHAAADPYFLYAASNLGSFAGLLFYPFVAEAHYTIPEQAHMWGAAYLLLAALAAVCTALVKQDVGAKAHESPLPALPRRMRLSWIALAFLPSGLLGAVTMYLTTEVVAVPLLWVIPLALYLLTFVIAFGRAYDIAAVWVARLTPVFTSVSIALVFIASPGLAASWGAMGWHMATCFLISLQCHGRLAALRPLDDARRLTDYYLMLALGGALGGMFNAFLAPVIFDRLVEYPLMLALAAFANPRFYQTYPVRHLLYGVIGAAGVMMLWAARRYAQIGFFEVRDITLIAVFTLVTFHPRALLAGACILALLSPYTVQNMKNLTTARNFFGVIKVYDSDKKSDGTIYHTRIFQHGTTMHSLQVTEGPMETRPVAYYGEGSPLEEVIDLLQPRKIAVLGLGAGTLACYATPEREMTFFEIDPAVVKMAQERFTYLDKCRGARPHRILTGDGRLELAKLKGETFDLIVLDAFSSDMVPVHLLSTEAIEMYKQHLAPGGMLAFNISNQYIKFTDIMGAGAKAAGMQARYKYKKDPQRPIQLGSAWLVMMRTEDDMEPLRKNGWAKPASDGMRPWTDDYSNILNVMKLRP